MAEPVARFPGRVRADQRRRARELIGGGLARLAAAWPRLDLVWSLVTGDIKARYRNSFLGLLWTLLNPLLMVTVLILVFSNILRFRFEDYWAYLLSGYFAWHFVQQAIVTGANVFVLQARVIRSVRIPSEVLLVSCTLSRLVEFVIGLAPVLIAVAALHHGTVPVSYVMVPIAVVLLFIITIGLQFPIAIMAVFFRDVQYGLPIVLTMIFYCSAIFYPLSAVPESIRELFYLNPMIWLMEILHDTIYWGRFPSLGLFLGCVAYSVGIGALGYVIFRPFKDRVAELV